MIKKGLSITNYLNHNGQLRFFYIYVQIKYFNVNDFS